MQFMFQLLVHFYSKDLRKYYRAGIIKKNCFPLFNVHNVVWFRPNPLKKLLFTWGQVDLPARADTY